jgi:hypothetical protein
MYLLLKLLHVVAALGLVTALEAVAAGRITPELREALDDRGVRRARALEAGLIAVRAHGDEALAEPRATPLRR